jgi:hypothetical protein
MPYQLRTLLILLAVLAGCDPKIERVRQGAEDVGDHAKRIEDAANPQTVSSLP